MDLLDSMLPAYLHGKRTLQDYLHMSDAQWEVFIHASPEEQLVYRAKCRPQTDDELYEYIKFVWGITFPRTCHEDCAKKEIPCTAPFKVFADAFFGRYPLIILKGSRGSGKSVLLGLLALCEQVCMDARVLVVGASETQSKVVFNYVSVRQTKFPDMFWRSPNAPVALMNAKDELQLSSVIVTGGEILCSPASETSVLGQRPSRLRLDEADKIKKDLVEGAIPCCHPDKYRKIKNQIILSSTHYSVDGTLTEYIERANQANKEAGEVVIPVYQFCYKDVLEENEGYITPELLRDMKLSVDKHTWLRQFENGEPAVEGALFSEEDLEVLFDDSLGTFDSDPKAHYEEHIVDEEKYQIYDAKKKPVYVQSYVGCDFGDKVDWTIISKFKCDEDDSHPDILTHWVKSGRCGLTTSVVRYNKLLSLEHSVAAHDATGGTGFVSEQLTEYSEPVIFNSNWKREALTQFISAVEQHRLRLPRIPTLEKCLRYITYDECFGSKHLPDEMASLILAWWARRRILKIFNIGSIKM